MSSSQLIDFAVITIFARETLEGGIIIGEFRTVICRSNWQNHDLSQEQALRAVTQAALAAALFALVVCAAVAIPLAVLSREFDDKTSELIEGTSKIVASICILQLSLKMPKFFGLYESKGQALRRKGGEDGGLAYSQPLESYGLTLSSIRFNVAWNIWREVAECGVFLIPFFLTGDGLHSIPLSALIGILVGGTVCLGIYYANQRFKTTVGLTLFTVSLLMMLSTGMFCGGCHIFEQEFGLTRSVWEIHGHFWSTDRLPMSFLKPFGYSDSRTVLQMATFWGWLFFGFALHYRKYRACHVSRQDEVLTEEGSACDGKTSPSAEDLQLHDSSRNISEKSISEESAENVDVEAA